MPEFESGAGGGGVSDETVEPGPSDILPPLPPGWEWYDRATGIARFRDPESGKWEYRAWDSQRGNYDPVTGRITYGGWERSTGPQSSSGGGSERRPQGSITSDELTRLNARFRGSVALIDNGDGTYDEYVRQPDGTFDLRRTNVKDNQQSLQSPEALSRALGATPRTPDRSSLGSMFQTGAGMRPTLSADDLFAAHVQPNIQIGESFGSAPNLFTGLSQDLPITLGGIYEGGGLTPLPGLSNFQQSFVQNPQFTGAFIGGGGSQTNIGHGFNTRAIIEAAGGRPINNDWNDPRNVALALQIMAARDSAASNPLLAFQDLASTAQRTSAVGSFGDEGLITAAGGANILAGEAGPELLRLPSGETQFIDQPGLIQIEPLMNPNMLNSHLLNTDGSPWVPNPDALPGTDFPFWDSSRWNFLTGTPHSLEPPNNDAMNPLIRWDNFDPLREAMAYMRSIPFSTLAGLFPSLGWFPSPSPGEDGEFIGPPLPPLPGGNQGGDGNVIGIEPWNRPPAGRVPFTGISPSPAERLGLSMRGRQAMRLLGS